MSSSSDALYRSIVKDIDLYLHRQGLNVSSARLRACLSLQSAIVKKFYPTDTETLLATRRAALELFSDCNSVCASWVSLDESLITSMRNIAEFELGELAPWSELLDNAYNGPGASVNSRGRNSSFEKYFTNPLTTTSRSLVKEWFAYVARFPSWAEAELNRIKLQDGFSCGVVGGSSMTTVPKNSTIDRTICTEPSLNMRFQLALGAAFERKLSKHYGYDSALQPRRNSYLAKVGSLDGSIATIDLHSASDLISLRLVERVLPPTWFAAVLDCRSPRVLVDGKYVTLNMVSTMGNGFTFPLETYIFSLILRSIARSENVSFSRYDRCGLSSNSSRFGVFGDDIVLPSSLYPCMMSALKSLGFKPNDEKSFSSGNFRESCGTDWYSGIDIRGVYCKELSSKQDHFSLINRLIRWSGRHRVPLRNTIQSLLPLDWRRYQIPSDLGDDAGIKTMFSLTGKRRPIYWSFSPKVKKFSLFIGCSDSLRREFDNPLGFILASTESFAFSSGLTRRNSRKPRYDVCRGFTPCWDNPVPNAKHGLGQPEWLCSLVVNLTGNH